MKCPGCGADVVEASVYCHKCGERLDAATEEQAWPRQQDPVDAATDAAPTPDPAERLRGMAGSAQGAAADREEPLWEGGTVSRRWRGPGS